MCFQFSSFLEMPTVLKISLLERLKLCSKLSLKEFDYFSLVVLNILIEVGVELDKVNDSLFSTDTYGWFISDSPVACLFFGYL